MRIKRLLNRNHAKRKPGPNTMRSRNVRFGNAPPPQNDDDDENEKVIVAAVPQKKLSIAEELRELRKEVKAMRQDAAARSNRSSASSGGGYSSSAHPVGQGSNSACSRCGTACYYDGRCGDGAVLMCNCDAAERAYWANDRR